MERAETTLADPSQAPTPTYTPEPVGIDGTALVDNTDIIFRWLGLNEKVDIIGEEGQYYVAIVDNTKVLIDKRLLYLEQDTLYEIWSGYAAKNSMLFDNYFLEGAPSRTLNLNDAVTVLDDLGFCYRIEANGVPGYIKATEVSNTKYYAGSNDGGSGGSSGSDGGDIVLPGFHGDKVSFSRTSIAIARENESVIFPTTGITRADNVEVYLGFINRDSIIKVIDENYPFLNVLFEGKQGVIRAQLIKLPSQEEMSTWNGYTKKDASYYSSYHFISNDPVGKLGVNTPVTVLYEINGCYMVDVEGGHWFIPTEQISTVDCQQKVGQIL